MKGKASSRFAAPIYVIVILLALGFSSAVNAQAPDQGDTPAELNRQIVELTVTANLKRLSRWLKKVVVLTKRAKELDSRLSLMRCTRSISAIQNCW